MRTRCPSFLQHHDPLIIFIIYLLRLIKKTMLLFSLKSGHIPETSLVDQCLRLRVPKVEGPGTIPGQGTRSHIIQLRPHMLHNKYQRSHMQQLRPCRAKKKKIQIYITLSINLELKYWNIIMWSGYRVIILTLLTVDPVKFWFI